MMGILKFFIRMGVDGDAHQLQNMCVSVGNQRQSGDNFVWANIREMVAGRGWRSV